MIYSYLEPIRDERLPGSLRRCLRPQAASGGTTLGSGYGNSSASSFVKNRGDG
jgi:hypothetical protein